MNAFGMNDYAFMIKIQGVLLMILEFLFLRKDGLYMKAQKLSAKHKQRFFLQQYGLQMSAIRKSRWAILPLPVISLKIIQLTGGYTSQRASTVKHLI